MLTCTRSTFVRVWAWWRSLGDAGQTLRTTTITQLDNAIPDLWDTKVRIDASRKAFWGARFTGGEGSNRPIIERTDFTKAPGDTIRVNVLAQLLRAGVTGESALQASEERLSLGQFTVTLTLVRNAVSVTELAQRTVNFDTVRAIGNMLSSWLSRRLDDDLWEQVLVTNIPTTIYAGNATTRATLGTDDTFSTQSIDRIKVALQRQGALPVKVQMDNEQELEFFGIAISEIDEYNLKGDANWLQSQREAGIRGDQNRIFSGALGWYNGCVVYIHRSVRMSGYFGSALRPEARLQTALNSSETTTIQVGPSTQDTSVNYTRFFPTTGTIRIDSEQIAYTGKSNATLTGITRAQGGSTGAAHSAGAVISLNNVSKALGFGAEMAARVWGLYPTRIRQLYDYENELGLGIKAYYGQRTVADNAGAYPNAVIMETYGANPNASI